MEFSIIFFIFLNEGFPNWKQKIVAYIGEQSYSYWDGSEGSLYYHDVSKLILNLVYIYIN